jgi:hypothetical protein
MVDLNPPVPLRIKVATAAEPARQTAAVKTPPSGHDHFLDPSRDSVALLKGARKQLNAAMHQRPIHPRDTAE